MSSLLSFLPLNENERRCCISDELIRSKTAFHSFISPVLPYFVLSKVPCATGVNNYAGLVGTADLLCDSRCCRTLRFFAFSDHSAVFRPTAFLTALSRSCRRAEFIRQPTQPAGPGLEVGHLPGPTHCTNLRRPDLPGPFVSQPQPQPAGDAVPEQLRLAPQYL